jgi:hypothetical protein
VGDQRAKPSGWPFPPQSASRDEAASESPQLSVQVFLRELRLPVLGGVEDVQDANCVLLNTVNGYMTMPALSLPDQDKHSCLALLSEAVSHLLRWNTLAGVDLSGGSINVGESFRRKEAIEVLGFLL